MVSPDSLSTGDALNVPASADAASAGVVAPVRQHTTPPHGSSAAVSETTDPFRAEATQVLARLRQAVERIVYSVTKVLTNSRTLMGVIKIDLNISWQMFKLLGSIDTLSTITYIPAGVSFKKFLNAAKKEGVAEPLLSEAAAAFAAFEQFIADTTGDRETFETAVMSYADSPEAAQTGMHYRKNAFKSDVHFFGVAVDTVSFSLLFHPAQQEGLFDLVGVRQMLGLRRLRANTDLLVERWKMNRSSESEDAFVLANALDAEAAAQYNAAVIPDFCSQPILPLDTVQDETGDVRTLLRHGNIGVGREVDITTARVYRGVTLDRHPDGQPAINGMAEIGRPTRLQVIDTFVHRATWPTLTAHSGIYAHLPSRVFAHVERQSVRLPFPEKVTFMGSGVDALRFPESPRYPELVRQSCERVGWNLQDFDLYRIRLEYPLMDSNIVSRLEPPLRG